MVVRLAFLFSLLVAVPVKSEKVAAPPGTLESLRREGCELRQKRDDLVTRAKRTSDSRETATLEKRIAEVEAQLELALLRFTKGGGRDFVLPDCPPPKQKE